MAMNALLAALKKSSPSPAMPDGDGPDLETADDAADDSAMDAKVGAALREQNPKMYQRLADEVGASSDDDAGAPPMSDMGDMDMPMPAKG